MPAGGTGPGFTVPLVEVLSGNVTVLRMTAIGSMQANMKRDPKIRGLFLPTHAATKRMKSEQAANLTAPKIAVKRRSRWPSPTSSWKNWGEKYARALAPVA